MRLTLRVLTFFPPLSLSLLYPLLKLMNETSIDARGDGNEHTHAYYTTLELHYSNSKLPLSYSRLPVK